MVGFHAAVPAAALPHAVVSVPVVHPPGTFSQGSLPPFVTLAGGEKVTTNALTASPRTTTAAAVAKPNAVVTTPPVVHPPGTFSQGDLPPFFTTPSGEKFTLSGLRF
jgi:hypothetical protein